MIQNGSKVIIKGEPGEVFTVSQLSGSRCWIGDSEGRGWYIGLDRLDIAEVEETAPYEYLSGTVHYNDKVNP